jgi:hypothetical protein
MKINTSSAPKEGAELNVMSSNLPRVGSQVEITRGAKAVAIGIVTEHTSNKTYKVLVVMSETGPQ